MTRILSHTPAWVFVLFVGLLILGLIHTKDRQVKQHSAYVLPLAMLGISFWGVQKNLGFTAAPVATWLMSLMIFALMNRQSTLRSNASQLSH